MDASAGNRRAQVDLEGLRRQTLALAIGSSTDSHQSAGPGSILPVLFEEQVRVLREEEARCGTEGELHRDANLW